MPFPVTQHSCEPPSRITASKKKAYTSANMKQNWHVNPCLFASLLRPLFIQLMCIFAHIRVHIPALSVCISAYTWTYGNKNSAKLHHLTWEYFAWLKFPAMPSSFVDIVEQIWYKFSIMTTMWENIYVTLEISMLYFMKIKIALKLYWVCLQLNLLRNLQNLLLTLWSQIFEHALQILSTVIKQKVQTESTHCFDFRKSRWESEG